MEQNNDPPRTPFFVKTSEVYGRPESQESSSEPKPEASSEPVIHIALKVSELCLLYRLKVEVLQNWIVTGQIPIPNDIDALNEGDCVRISLMQFFTSQGWSVGWASSVVRYITDDLIMTLNGAYLREIPIGEGCSVNVFINPHRARIRYLVEHKEAEMAKGSEALRQQAHRAQEMLKEVVRAGNFTMGGL